MTKTAKAKKTGNEKTNNQNAVVSAAKKKIKPKREVQVVSCPSAFPISDRTKIDNYVKKRPRDDSYGSGRGNAEVHHNEQRQRQQPQIMEHGRTTTYHHNNKPLDWHDTAKEIRGYGAKAFAGKQKRDYEDEQYFLLTGRHKKKQSVPLPIVRGIKKAAAKRDAKERQEARDAGIILPKAITKDRNNNNHKNDSIIRHYGPAPSVGFMKRGVLRVQDKRKGKGSR